MSEGNIVTYRSEMERAVDQYYWEALSNSDPAMAVMVIQAVGALSLLAFLFYLHTRFKIFKP